MNMRMPLILRVSWLELRGQRIKIIPFDEIFSLFFIGKGDEEGEEFHEEDEIEKWRGK